MNRADFVAAAVAVIAAPTAGRSKISAEIDIRRDSAELLAPFTVAIAVRNPTTHSIALDFPTADIYRIDVRRAGETVWSTATGHKPLQIARRIDIGPGLTRLASQIVDGTTDDRRAYAPGAYTVRVAMLGSEIDTGIEQTIAFAPPLTIAEARAAKGATVITIAGLTRTNAGVAELYDTSGTIRLSRPLGVQPTGTYVVRGYLDAVNNDIQFAVGRFAPAFENIAEARAKPPA